MNSAKTILLTAFLSLMVLPSWAWAQNENYSRFKNVTSESKSDELVLRFEFDRRFVTLPESVISRTSIQLDFNNATIVPAKKFFYTSDSVIPQIYVYQPIEGTVRVRLGLAEKIEDVAGRLEMARKGRFLEVRINKEKPAVKEVSKESDILQQLLSRASKEVTPNENRTQRPVPVQSAALTQEIPASKNNRSIPTEELSRTRKTPDNIKSAGKATNKKDSAFSAESFELSNTATLDVMPSGLRMVTMLLLVVAFMLLLFYLFKKFVLKNTPFGGSGKLVQVLGTGFLGPRNNIALVEVAGDVLVLGISNDNITLLSHIEDEEKIADIKSRSLKNNPVKGKLDTTIKKAISQSPTPGPAKRKPFVNVLRQFANPKTSKDKSVAEVSAQIRRNLNKIQKQ